MNWFLVKPDSSLAKWPSDASDNVVLINCCFIEQHDSSACRMLLRHYHGRKAARLRIARWWLNHSALGLAQYTTMRPLRSLLPRSPAL